MRRELESRSSEELPARIRDSIYEEVKQESILDATFALQGLRVGKYKQLRDCKEGEEESLEHGRGFALLSEERGFTNVIMIPLME